MCNLTNTDATSCMLYKQIIQKEPYEITYHSSFLKIKTAMAGNFRRLILDKLFM